MKTTTSITGVDGAQIGERVRQLETAGFSAITTQENRFNPFLPLSVAAVNSESIELRTSVAIAFARSPMASANLGWDLQTMSNGRFTLGLGSQVKGHNIRRFSVPWSPPAPRMREYVQAVKAIWHCWQNDEPLKYKGEHYQFTLMTPNFTPPKQTNGLPKIQIAAVGQAMMKVAAEECDGAMLHGFCTRKYLEEVIVPRIQGSLDKAGRSRADFEMSGGGFVATGETDEDVQKQFEWIRQRVGFYGSTPSYWPVFECHGLEDLGQELNAMSKSGQWDEMTDRVPDDVVHMFAAVGRYDEIASAIQDRFGGLVDVVGMPEGTPADLLQDIASLK